MSFIAPIIDRHWRNCFILRYEPKRIRVHAGTDTSSLAPKFTYHAGHPPCNFVTESLFTFHPQDLQVYFGFESSLHSEIYFSRHCILSRKNVCTTSLAPSPRPPRGDFSKLISDSQRLWIQWDLIKCPCGLYRMKITEQGDFSVGSLPRRILMRSADTPTRSLLLLTNSARKSA